MIDIDLATAGLIFKGPASPPTNFLSPRTKLEEVANGQAGDYREYESN